MPEGPRQCISSFISLFLFGEPSWISHSNFIIVLRLFKLFVLTILDAILLSLDILPPVLNLLILRKRRRQLVYKELQDQILVVKAGKGSICSLN